jgi:hypothetical protein
MKSSYKGQGHSYVIIFLHHFLQRPFICLLDTDRIFLTLQSLGYHPPSMPMRFTFAVGLSFTKMFPIASLLTFNVHW